MVVDHRAEPAQWDELLTIPFGSGPTEIGISDCSDCEVAFPAGLAVASDASFWLLDEQKARVAHFSRSGALVAAVDVSGRHRGSMTAATMARGAVMVAFSSGRLLKITDEGIRREVTLHIHGLPLYPFSLVTRSTWVHVETVGGAQSGKGYVGYGEVSFEELGLVMPEPGLPLADGGFLAAGYEKRVETLTWMDADGLPTTSRELTVEARRSEGNRPTNFNLYPNGSTDRGVTALVNSIDRSWFFRIEQSGRPILERLPDSSFFAKPQDLVTGADGRIYFMALADDGVHIFRR